jgi:5-methylcytosine-specific restriction endonuclease McrA
MARIPPLLRCSKCATSKGPHEFYAHRGRSTGFSAFCKTCAAAKQKAWYQANKVRRAEYAKTYREANKDRIRLDKQRWADANREHVAEQKRAYAAKHKDRIRNSLLKKYGMSEADYQRMLLAQNGKCAICGSTESGTSATTCLAVDHCHKTGAVRGLLCGPCNKGIGHLKDDISLLYAAITYLGRAG